MTPNEEAMKDNQEVTGRRSHETMVSLTWRRFRRHPGAMAGAIVLMLVALAISLAHLSPYDPELSDIKNRYQPPSLEHPFGTDGLGRDLMTRVLYGGRVSMSVGLMVMTITLIIGIPVGALAGYYADRWLGTAPLFLLIGIGLGIGAAFRNLFVLTKRARREEYN